jgi:hypothetical protein
VATAVRISISKERGWYFFSHICISVVSWWITYHVSLPEWCLVMESVRIQ